MKRSSVGYGGGSKCATHLLWLGARPPGQVTIRCREMQLAPAHGVETVQQSGVPGIVKLALIKIRIIGCYRCDGCHARAISVSVGEGLIRLAGPEIHVLILVKYDLKALKQV